MMVDLESVCPLLLASNFMVRAKCLDRRAVLGSRTLCHLLGWYGMVHRHGRQASDGVVRRVPERVGRISSLLLLLLLLLL
jgi:hypothetical protein